MTEKATQDVQKTAFEKIMNLNTEKVVFAIKIIDLDAEVFVKKKMVTLVFEIYGSGIYIAMTLIN